MIRTSPTLLLSLVLLLGAGPLGVQADVDNDFEDVDFVDEDLDALFDELGIDPDDEDALQEIIDSDGDSYFDRKGGKPKKRGKKSSKKARPEISGEYANLVKRSPFLPPGYAVDEDDEDEDLIEEGPIEAPPPPAQDLEMTAMVVSADGDLTVSLRNKSGDSFLVRKKDPQAIYKLIDFNIEKKSIILNDGFSNKTLKLVEPEPASPQIQWDQLSKESSIRKAPTPEEIEEERETTELLKRLLEE